MCGAVGLMAAMQMGIRAYGWRLAALVPVRALWANQANGLATAAALLQFFKARLRRRDLAWRKTDHVYPAHRRAANHAPRTPPRRASRAIAQTFRRGAVPCLKRSRGHSRRTPCPRGHRVATRAAARRWKILPYRIAMSPARI
jgi:hypothetical protein